MRYWSVTLASVVVVAVLLSPTLPVSAQSETEPAPRTAGQPDLVERRPPDLGVWEYKTRTPLERPERFGEREFLTEEEAAEIAERERARIQAMEERPAQRTVAIPTAGDRPGRWLDSPDHPSLEGQTGSYNICEGLSTGGRPPSAPGRTMVRSIVKISSHQRLGSFRAIIVESAG